MPNLFTEYIEQVRDDPDAFDNPEPIDYDPEPAPRKRRHYCTDRTCGDYECATCYPGEDSTNNEE